jgi:hypothetical protein
MVSDSSGMWGLVNGKGETVAPVKYVEIDSFKMGLQKYMAVQDCMDL